jgi:ligand-binding SRPBCC domain-containing protein
MSATYRVRVASSLFAPPNVVWAHASSMEGVNEELYPIRMTYPAGARLDGEVPLGRPLFRSLVTLFGVVPLDVHELALAGVEAGRGFHEESRTLLEARWRHERTLTPIDGGGTLVEDEVTFTPRALGALIAWVVAGAFARRHAVLRRKYGEVMASGKVRAVLERMS